MCTDCKPFAFYDIPATVYKPHPKFKLFDNETLQISIIIPKESLKEFLLISVCFIVWFSLILKIYSKAVQSNIRIRKCFHATLTVVNLIWIVACLLLLTQSVASVIGQRINPDNILALFPWYIAAIISCCLIELFEACVTKKSSTQQALFLQPYHHQKMEEEKIKVIDDYGIYHI